MCWNKETSLSSFIIGSIINFCLIIYFINKSEPFMYALFISWQWILMMQLAEYFIWLDQENGKINKYATKAAMVFNITQPIFIFLVIICFLNIPITNKILACIIILFYIIYMLIKFNEDDEYININRNENCSHLNLKWWEDKYSGIIYCITLALIMILLYRPTKIMLFILFFIFIALIISQKFYGCGGPSMWCWFVVPFPIFATLFYNYFIKK